MKIIFLGTNGWYSSPTGNTACILIDCKEGYIILDAGSGFYKLDQYIKLQKPIFLFISHFHIDHVSGLHTLSKFNFSQGIDVFVGEDRKKDFDTLFNSPFTSPDTSTQIRVTELKTGKHNLPFPVEIIEQSHAYKDHSYRLTIENKTIAYSGDCGISINSMKLAKDVDLLIHECSFKAPHPSSSWGHVGPLEAAQLAKDAQVKKLVLTHFDASQYITLEDRTVAKNQAKTIFANTTAAQDNLTISL